MKTIKFSIALIFVAGLVAALAGQTFGYPPLLAKAKRFGAKDCTFCHVDPEGGPPWNERGKWLIHCHIPHHTTNNNTEMKGGGGLMVVIDVQ